MVVKPRKTGWGPDGVLEVACLVARRAAVLLGHGDGVPPTQFAE
jgi:hypothetical protein